MKKNKPHSLTLHTQELTTLTTAEATIPTAHLDQPNSIKQGDGTLTVLNNISPSNFFPSRPVTALTLTKTMGSRLTTPSLDIFNITPSNTNYANYLRSREAKGLKSEKKFAEFLRGMGAARVASAKKLQTTIDSFAEYDKETKEMAKIPIQKEFHNPSEYLKPKIKKKDQNFRIDFTNQAALLQEEKRFNLVRNAISGIQYETEHADSVIKYISRVPIDEKKLLEPNYVSTIRDNIPKPHYIHPQMNNKKIEFGAAVEEMRQLHIEDIETSSQLDFDSMYKYNQDQLKKLQSSLGFVTRRMIKKNQKELAVTTDTTNTPYDINDYFKSAQAKTTTHSKKKSFSRRKEISGRMKHQPSIDEFLKNGGVGKIDINQNENNRASVFMVGSIMNIENSTPTLQTLTPTINVIPSEADHHIGSESDFKTFEFTQVRNLGSPNTLSPDYRSPRRSGSMHSAFNFIETANQHQNQVQTHNPTQDSNQKRTTTALPAVANKDKKDEKLKPHEHKQALKGTIAEILYQSKHADNDDLKSKAIGKVKKLMMQSQQGKHVRYPDEKLETRQRYNVDITTMVSPKKITRMVKEVKNEFFKNKVEEDYDPHYGNKTKGFVHVSCKQITKDCERAIKSTNHLSSKMAKKFDILNDELRKMAGIIDGQGIDIDAEIKDDIKKEMQVASDYMFALNQKRSASEVSKQMKK